MNVYEEIDQETMMLLLDSLCKRTVYLKVDMAHLAECPLDFEEVIRLG